LAGNSAAMTPEERPSKRDAFLAFYAEGWVSVHLDARRAGVDVPADFNDNRHLVLQYGRDMPVAIPDLTVDDDGIRATLSFSRTPHSTFIPWNAVYIVACTDGRGILYYEDVPEDVSLVARAVDPETGEPIEGDAVPGIEGAEENDLTTLPFAAGAERRSGAVAPLRPERLLKSVPASEDAQDTPEVDAAAQADSPRRRKRPQLKLVK
jgi:stringent starvation protein B